MNITSIDTGMGLIPITLSTKVKDLCRIGSFTFDFHPWSKIGEMSLGTFLKDGHKIKGFGRIKYNHVIRAAVFDPNIEHDARETILREAL